MEDVLDELEYTDRSFKYASKGKRFTNYIIDIGVFYLLVFAGSLLYYSNQDVIYIEDESAFDIVETLISMLMTAIYYTIVEGAMKGKTLGKLITRTRTVTENNEVPDFQTILTKSFCRIIPFNALSFLGSQETGWHDRFSKTKVIED